MAKSIMDSPSGPYHLQKTIANLRAISGILMQHRVIEGPLTRKSDYGQAIAHGLRKGLVKELKPYIAWSLDHSHRYHFAAAAGIEYQLIKEVVKHAELQDIVSPRLRKALNHFLDRERRSFTNHSELTSEFTGPALGAKAQKSLALLVSPLIPQALNKYKKAGMLKAHAQLALGWYGSEAVFTRVPGMRQITCQCGPDASPAERADFIQNHALNEPFIKLLNAIRHSSNPGNASLQSDLRNLRARMISVMTRFQEEKAIPVIIDFNEPGQPAIFCNTSRSPASDMLPGIGSPFDRKEWDIAPALLYQTHEFLEEIMMTGPCHIACDALIAQQQIRHHISKNASLYASMPAAFRGRYGPVSMLPEPAPLEIKRA